MKKYIFPQHALVYTLLLFLCAQFAFAQLPAFSFSVTKTDETCTGNGTLNFSVSGTTPGSSIFYSIYLIPDLTTPIAVVNTPSLGGLAAGSYAVIATQSLGAESNTQQQNLQIMDYRAPLAYQLIGGPINCATGKITVNVLQGTAATFEISSGPVLVAPQASNTFLNLPNGQYTIKVTDICGDVLVRDFTLVYVFDPTDMTIGNASTSCDMTSCTTKTVDYEIKAALGTNILYPFEVQLTVFPPNGGTPVVFTQTLSSGGATSEDVSFTIPYYEQTYLTNIKFTDLCGNTYEQNNIPISAAHSMILFEQLPRSCHKLLGIDGCNLLPPYMIEFVSAPAGFNPTIHNPIGLGPFNSLPIIYNYNTASEIEVPSGDYIVKLTDACGVVIQKTIRIRKSVTDFEIKQPRLFDGCILNTVIRIPASGIPINTAVITQAPEEYEFGVPHDLTSAIVDHTLEVNLTVPGTYIFNGINVCDEPYQLIIEIKEPNIKPYIIADNQFGCENFHGTISIGYLEGEINGILYEEGPEWANITITQAPPEFQSQHTLPYDASEFIMQDTDLPFKNTIAKMENLPIGNYVFYLTDVCRKTYGPFPVRVPVKPYLDPPNVSVLEGCEPGVGSLQFRLPGYNNIRFQTVTMTAAPVNSSFTALLPYTVDFGITGNRNNFSMNNLPAGDYTFKTKDICGTEHTLNVTIGNHYYDATADFDGNCGSFNLFIHHPPVISGIPVYYVLQKWNPAISRWIHPITGAIFQPGTYPNSVNSYFLNDANYNITSQGDFRILKLSVIYSTGSDALISCITTLREFQFLGQLKITDAYKISCVSGSSQVFIVAGDTNPLHYYITQKDGQPFAVDNNESNVFNGLVPGIYNFMVRDLCGNEVNRLFDVTTLGEPVVTPTNLCDGQSGLLSIPPFSFLSYQWWKADNPTTILSTTNELHFDPFSIATTPGTYFIRIYSQSTLSCLDTTITYVVPNAIDPHAGDDNELTICARGPLNLNTMLNGIHDTNGYWSEVTNSGMLTGNIWLPLGVAAGTYQFKYTVTGFCGVFDDALITINLLENLPVPVVTMNAVFCTGNDIQFHVDTIPNVTYEWTGPNNFTSSEQNPTIPNSTADNNGLYTVKASANGCDSSATITVDLQPGPDFHLNAACVNGVYTVSAVANSSSALDDVTYSWTGPENFTNNQNPVPIAGLSPGLYAVTITSQEGCVVTDDIEVRTTVCSVPNVITPNDDSANDNWDLTEFDVRRVEIYSRWGRLVYEQNNYTDQWHGQNSHNEELPDSTYYYILYLGSGEEKQGWVFKTSW